MTDVEIENRRRVLTKYLTEECGGNKAELARRIGRSNSQTNDLLAGRGSFGAKLARSIEAKLLRPKYWLDGTSGVAKVQAPAFTVSASGSNVEAVPIRARVPLISWVSAGKWITPQPPSSAGCAASVHQTEKYFSEHCCQGSAFAVF